MTFDLNPGARLLVDGCQYTVEEQQAFHDVDFRLDLLRLSGPTRAHERWLLAALSEPYPMLMQQLEMGWLAPPQTSIVHDGELFANLLRGVANRSRRTRTERTKDARVEYALFRANSGRVIFLAGQNERLDAWIGMTLPLEAIVVK